MVVSRPKGPSSSAPSAAAAAASTLTPSSSSSSQFAGPGFYVSPAPEELPYPRRRCSGLAPRRARKETLLRLRLRLLLPRSNRQIRQRRRRPRRPAASDACCASEIGISRSSFPSVFTCTYRNSSSSRSKSETLFPLSISEREGRHAKRSACFLSSCCSSSLFLGLLSLYPSFTYPLLLLPPLLVAHFY